ncbi:hypothetical protein GGF50DRAFT_93067 [Schizophyllum commune]
MALAAVGLAALVAAAAFGHARRDDVSLRFDQRTPPAKYKTTLPQRAPRTRLKSLVMPADVHNACECALPACAEGCRVRRARRHSRRSRVRYAVERVRLRLEFGAPPAPFFISSILKSPLPFYVGVMYYPTPVPLSVTAWQIGSYQGGIR